MIIYYYLIINNNMYQTNLNIINKRVSKKEIPILEKDGYIANLTGNVLHVYKGKLHIEIEIPTYWPFKPPSIKVNNHNYTNLKIVNEFRVYYRGHYLTSNEYIQQTSNKKCLCCDSLLCGDKWHPFVKMIDLVKEVEDVIKIRRRLVDNVMIQKLKENYQVPGMWKGLPQDLPFEEYI